jgi:hypothetical protein
MKLLFFFWKEFEKLYICIEMKKQSNIDELSKL